MTSKFTIFKTKKHELDPFCFKVLRLEIVFWLFLYPSLCLHVLKFTVTSWFILLLSSSTDSLSSFFSIVSIHNNIVTLINSITIAFGSIVTILFQIIIQKYSYTAQCYWITNSQVDFNFLLFLYFFFTFVILLPFVLFTNYDYTTEKNTRTA